MRDDKSDKETVFVCDAIGCENFITIKRRGLVAWDEARELGWAHLGIMGHHCPRCKDAVI